MITRVLAVERLVVVLANQKGDRHLLDVHHIDAEPSATGAELQVVISTPRVHQPDSQIVLPGGYID